MGGLGVGLGRVAVDGGLVFAGIENDVVVLGGGVRVQWNFQVRFNQFRVGRGPLVKDLIFWWGFWGLLWVLRGRP